MTETITDGPGPRHVFAPYPDRVERMLHLINVAVIPAAHGQAPVMPGARQHILWRSQRF